MNDDEVLAAGLADDARVVAVAADIAPDRRPDAVEDPRRACEVHSGEIGAREGSVADRGARAGQHVDHAVRQARLLEQAHDVVGRQHRRRGGLPENDVSHQCGRRRQVAGDRREVERRDREHEAFERAVFEPVRDARRRDRLHLVDPRRELDVEAEEVDQLAGGVDLSLLHGLRLAEHRRGEERVAPGAGEQLRSAEKDRGAVFGRPARPVLRCRRGSSDRQPDVLGTALVDVREHVLRVVGRDRRFGRPGANILAADHEGDLDPLGAHLREPALDGRALRATRRVIANWLVDRWSHTRRIRAV